MVVRGQRLAYLLWWCTERCSDKHIGLIVCGEDCHSAWYKTTARRRFLHDFSPYWTGTFWVMGSQRFATL